MGALIAKFRKEKSSYEILEKLEIDIKSIEDYGLSTQRQRRQIIGNLIITSIGIYVVGAALIYQYFLPQSWSERLLYVAPLLVFPLIIVLFKKFVAWYYDREISKNSQKLMKMRATKRKILEEVMEKKTYKEAQKILERFGEKSTVSKLIHNATPQMVKQIPEVTNSTKALGVSPYNNTPVVQKGSLVPSRVFGLSNTHSRSELIPSQTHRPLPRPLLSINRSVLDKLVDYLIGDGPTSRYALICTQCQNHNGMALKEEFQYLAFRCAFCATFNPARKQRPIAPILPNDSHKETNSDSSEECNIDESDKLSNELEREEMSNELSNNTSDIEATNDTNMVHNENSQDE